MSILKFFSRGFLWRHLKEHVRVYAIIGCIQVACMAVAPSLGWASEPAWKTFFAQGEQALAQEKPADAEQYFRKALALAESNSSDWQGREESMMKLADTLTLRNKTAEAQRLYERLLGILVRKYGNSKRIVLVLMSLGSIQESAGDHKAAITYYQRALRINEKNYGPYSPQFAENLHSLARANTKAGHRGDAAKQYKQAIAILLKEPGLRASEQLKSTMSDYSDLLKGNDDSDKSLIKDFQKDLFNNPLARANNSESLPNSRNKTAVSETEPGYSSRLHPQETTIRVDESAWQKQASIAGDTSKQAQLDENSAVALRGLTQPWSDKTLLPAYKVVNDSIVRQGRYEEGEAYYQRMIAVDIDALGPHHPSVANDLNGLAQLYIHRQNYGQAEPLLSRAYAIYQEVYGMDNLLTINACASYALVEFHLGKIEKASELYRTALSHSESALGPNNFETARVLNELAYLYFHQGKLQEASTFYKWALASTEGAVGQESPLLAACMHDYARVLRSLGQSAEADVLESRANSILIGAK